MPLDFNAFRGSLPLLKPEQQGVPDYGNAIRKGFETYEAANKPRALAEKLLTSRLNNMVTAPFAENADKWFNASLEGKNSENAYRGALLHKALMDAALSKSNLDFLDNFNGSNNAPNHTANTSVPNQQVTPQQNTNNIQDNIKYPPVSMPDQSHANVSAEGPGVAASPSAYDTFPGRRAPTQAQPSLHDNVSSALSRVPEKLPNGMTYADSVRASKIMGLPASEIKDINGTLTAITPWGNVQVAQGPTAQEKARQAGLGKVQSTAYENAYNMSNSLEGQNSSLDYLINKVEGDKSAQGIVGPINQMLTKLVGDPQAQGLLGQINTASGNIMLDVAHNVKGAWTGKDQSMVNNIKPNSMDPYGIFVGKLKAMRSLNELTKQRTDIIADLTYKGYAPHEAAKIAREKVSFAPVEQQVSQLLKNTTAYADLQSNKSPTFATEQDAVAFMKTLTAREKEKLLSILGEAK